MKGWGLLAGINPYIWQETWCNGLKELNISVCHYLVLIWELWFLRYLDFCALAIFRIILGMLNTWITWNWKVQGRGLFTEIKPYLCKCYIVMEDTCSSTIQAYHSFSARGKSCDGLQAHLWQGALHETLTLCLVLSQIANISLLTLKWLMMYLLSATAILSHLTWYSVFLQIWTQCGLFILAQKLHMVLSIWIHLLWDYLETIWVTRLSLCFLKTPISIPPGSWSLRKRYMWSKAQSSFTCYL